ncbi:MAG: response regulator [Desulfuromonadales bacterium]|nr:response regulator [Desulfuromonadales bacterium]
MNPTVMIVDDALFMRKILRGILEENGYQVVAEAASGIETMRRLHDHRPDIIILDIILPDANGLDLLKSIFSASPLSRVAICSAIGQEQVIQKALDLGAKAFIQKPFTPEKVITALASMEG